MFSTFARLITGLNRGIGKVAAWIVIPLFLLLIFDVTMRYFAGRPMVWSAETAQLLFGVYGIIAGGYLLAERGHVNVDIIYGRLSRKRKATADLATCFLMFFFVGVLLWYGWQLAAESVGRLERSNSVWKPYIWPVKVFIPVAAILLLLQGLVRLVADIRVVMGLPVDERTYGKLPDEEEGEGTAEGAAR